MDRARRELLVARICSGTVRLKLPKRVLLLGRTSSQQRYIANELYFEVLRESELNELYSDDELLDFLMERGFWDEDRQTLLDKLPKEIEEFKLALFKSTFKSNERKTIRKALQTAKAKHAELFEQRNAYTHLSCSGAAALAKARYLFGCALQTQSGKKVFGSEAAFWGSKSSLLDDCMVAYSANRIDEVELRELARTEPWKSIWSGRTHEGRLFDVSPADYTDEQASLVSWSGLYDNIYQHQECPPDAVLEDDDALDGWLINQRRTRDAGVKSNSSEELVKNEKIRNSQEVYLVAETLEDARNVIDLNDEVAKATQRKRFKYLKEKGEVNEVDMPDTKARLRMEVTKKLSAAMKGVQS